jgi:catechol 2,3-dioxygenase-like lactoylglutathione lyase family enzyme
MFQRVNAVVLFVQDFEKCLSFYRDTLGLEVVQLEPAFAAFRMKDHNFAISHVSEGAEMVNAPISAPPITGTQRIMLCAELENVDTAYETLTAKGVEFTRAPVSQPWGIRAAYFKDPEANLWEIYHSLNGE